MATTYTTFSLLRLPDVALRNVLAKFDSGCLCEFSVLSKKCKKMARRARKQIRLEVCLEYAETTSLSVDVEKRYTTRLAERVAHLLDVFKLKACALTVNMDRLRDGEGAEFRRVISLLRHRIDTLKLTGTEMSGREVRFVLDNASSLQSLEIVAIGSPDLRLTDPVRVERSIRVTTAYWVKVPVLLFKLDAPEIHLEHPNLTSKEMNVMFKQWMGGAMPRLKTLTVQGFLTDDELFRGIDYRYFREERRIELVRKTDGIVGMYCFSWKDHNFQFTVPEVPEE